MSTPARTTDKAHDVLRQEREPLHAIFNPRTVAVVGATETHGSVGRTVLWNLISSPFGGTVYPVNPKRANVLGIKAYPSIGEIPDKVDLAVIVTPAGSVPGVIGQCAEAGVQGVIIISAGFKEMGESGVALEKQVLEQARKGRMRIIGPNCLGVMNPTTGLNATFASGIARPGNVAFISQSGALLTAILDWSFREQVGFSAFVSAGTMLDVDWGDLVDYLGNDPKTQSILIYMESIGDARSFMSAAREVGLNKPIIVIKPGRTAQAAKAAASHTGSLTGGDDVVDAAFRRSGVLRVNTISDLFHTAEVLAKQPRPQGPRLTIVTNAGGPGVLATDALIMAGGELATISPETMDQLNALLPAPWSHNNPIDVLGDAGADRYVKTLEIAAKDSSSDGLLVVLTPQDMTEPTQTAEALKGYSKIEGKPVLASWMGGPFVHAGVDILNRAGIPTFDYPDTAARMFYNMFQYSHNLKALYETPQLPDDRHGAPDRAAAEAILNGARNAGRDILTEYESKKLLEAYRIPTVPTEIATTADQAAQIATKMGFPTVLKIHSETITHKTDVGGVLLNLKDEAAVRKGYADIEASVAARAGLVDDTGKKHFLGVTVQPMAKLADAYEIILGSSIDPQFGPVLLFGTGGQLVEVYKDRSLALPPLNATLARRMMEKTRIYTALKGVRGRPPVDMHQLETLMVRFSQLVSEQPCVKEIDINPLMVSHAGIIALDARVIVFDKSVPDDKLPQLAIRPYPSQYVKPFAMRNGMQVIIRPIRPEDEPLMVDFHQTLSERSVRLRYFAPMKLSQRVTHERLIRVCYSDYDRELPLVPEYTDPATGKKRILGVGRLSKIPGTNDSEFAILVTDEVQNQGLGSELLRQLVDVARAEKLASVSADILPENLEMQRVCEKIGFTLKRDMNDSALRAEIRL